MLRSTSSVLAVALLAACGVPGLDDPSFPTGSSTVAGSSDHRVLYAADPFDGTVSAMRTGSDEVGRLELGGEPTRIARVGDELWVTQRATRSIAILDASGAELSLQRKLDVGAEPYGVVATEDGSRVYVTMSQDDEVWEFDGASHEVLRTWTVPDDPRWLALHPSERSLIVVSAYKAAISRIDLVEGVVDSMEPPSVTRPTGGGDIELTPRTTGDPAFSPSGDALSVPVLYVDIDTPVDDPKIDDSGEVRPPAGGGGYSSAGSANTELSIGRMNPAIAAFPFDERSGEPHDDEPALAVFVGGNLRGGPVRGYVSSTTFAPTGTEVMATLESADAVAIVSLLPFEPQGTRKSRTGFKQPRPSFDRQDSPFVPPSVGGFYDRPQAFVSTHSVPTGVALTANGRAFVYESGARSFSNASLKDATKMLDELTSEEDVFTRVDRLPEVVQENVVGSSTLPAAVERGRKLFYSATSPSMVAEGAGVSCSTCHTEGRNDGLTWTFEDGVRQTPSLAGEVSLTAPVTWTSQVESVGREAQITSAGRMGGHGLSDAAAADIGAFVDWTRRVDVSTRIDDALVARGEEIFHREEVGCGTCHSGEAYTDNAFHDLYGLVGVNTPTLVGIAATAPYLHDGSAQTLRDVLETARAGLMGDTSMLSGSEMDALEAYLASL